MKLVEPLLNWGYCFTGEKFYTSPEVVDKFISHKTDVYRTLRPTRKDVPLMKGTKLQKRNVMTSHRGNSMALQWRDKKQVA